MYLSATAINLQIECMRWDSRISKKKKSFRIQGRCVKNQWKDLWLGKVSAIVSMFKHHLRTNHWVVGWSIINVVACVSYKHGTAFDKNLTLTTILLMGWEDACVAQDIG